MSFQDSAVIFFIALLLFGPKKLPELARQLGKLMGEFRRASNEFRMQLEDELRTSEQADKQKQIAALEAAAPPPGLAVAETSQAPESTALTTESAATSDLTATPVVTENSIANHGDLHLRAPETGLPLARGAAEAPVADAFSSIPELPPDRHTTSLSEPEPPAHHA